MTDYNENIARRLARYISVQGEDECWPWTGAKTTGYGVLSTCRNGYRENILAHRTVWERANGPIAGELVVMHLCNNPACCNLKHLKLGTFKENNDQVHAQGRRPPFNRKGKYAIVGIYKWRKRWIAVDSQGKALYRGRDFFEACCARKSWEAKQQAKFGFVWDAGEWVPV